MPHGKFHDPPPRHGKFHDPKPVMGDFMTGGVRCTPGLSLPSFHNTEQWRQAEALLRYFPLMGPDISLCRSLLFALALTRLSLRYGWYGTMWLSE